MLKPETEVNEKIYAEKESEKKGLPDTGARRVIIYVEEISRWIFEFTKKRKLIINPESKLVGKNFSVHPGALAIIPSILHRLFKMGLIYNMVTNALP